MSGQQRALGLFAAGLALIALLAWLFLGSSSERAAAGAGAAQASRGEAAAAAAAPSVSTGERAAILDPPETESSTPAPAAAPVEEGPLLPLTGYVLNEAQEGIGEALVFDVQDGTSVRAAADGRFTLRVRPQGPWEQRQLFAWAPGWSLEQSFADFDDAPCFVLKPQAPLALRVIDRRNGAPVAGARAWLGAYGMERYESGFLHNPLRELPVPIAPSGADGALSLPAWHANVRLVVDAEGFERFQKEVHERTQLVALAAAEALRLRCLRPDGSAVAGATVAFPQFSATAATDAAGWVDLPARAGAALWGTQVQDGERFWLHQGDPTETTVDAPATIVVEHFPRHGSLALPAGESGANYEVATTGGSTGLFVQLEPNPERHGDALRWQPVAADGGFTIDAGWQSRQTTLLVRRAADRVIVHSELLPGPGPYRIAFAARLAVRIVVLAQPPEALAEARLQLRRAWDGEAATGALALAGGAAETSLAPGEYRVDLRLPERAGTIELGGVTVESAPIERVFDLGRVRSLSGTVRAGGEPLFPCILYLRNESGWSEEIRSDQNGRWQLDWVPETQVSVHLRPEDPWLVELGRAPYQSIPDAVTEYAIDLPVATLELSLDPNWPLDGSKLHVQREPLTPVEEGVPAHWDKPPRLPPLDGGVARLRTTPCALAFSTFEPFTVLETERLELQANEVRHLQVRGVRAGRVQVRLRDDAGLYLAERFELEPAAVAAPTAAWNRAPAKDYSYHDQAVGAVRPAYHCLPGTWTVRLRAPIRWAHDHQKLAIEAGAWDLELPVEAGRTTIVWLRRGPDGRYAAAHEVVE